MSGGSSSVQETSAQKALAEHAQNLMADYKARWLPVQQNLASQIESLKSPDSPFRKEAAGKASTDTAIQFSEAQGALGKALSNHGAAPGSGRADLATVGLGADAAKSSGLNQMISGQQIDDAYTKGLGALTQIGQGQSAQVGASLENQAAASGQQAQADARAALEDQMGIGGAVGTAVGLGIQQLPASGLQNWRPVGNGSNPNAMNGSLNNPSSYVG
jgi:hypothetical protein